MPSTTTIPLTEARRWLFEIAEGAGKGNLSYPTLDDVMVKHRRQAQQMKRRRRAKG